MSNWFCKLFHSDYQDRDKFLARLQGLFSEEIVRIWCESKRSPYKDLGRPNVKVPPDKKGYTMDFTLQSKKDGSKYIAEMKCWTEYKNYQYLTLVDAEQLEEIDTRTFDVFFKSSRKSFSL